MEGNQFHTINQYNWSARMMNNSTWSIKLPFHNTNILIIPSGPCHRVHLNLRLCPVHVWSLELDRPSNLLHRVNFYARTEKKSGAVLAVTVPFVWEPCLTSDCPMFCLSSSLTTPPLRTVPFRTLARTPCSLCSLSPPSISLIYLYTLLLTSHSSKIPVW